MTDGLIVAGRSSADHDRGVRSPAHAMFKDYATLARQLATALGLTPASRKLHDAPAESYAIAGPNPFNTPAPW